MRYSKVVAVVVVILLMLAGLHCAPTDSHETFNAAESGPVNEDLVLFSDGKEDSAFFNPNRLIEQSTFEDADFMSLQEIQYFLENTPYGHASFLATYQWNGEPVAQIIHRVSQTYDINPLIILTKIQVESSLIFRTVADPYRVEVALGCGCLDEGPACGAAPLGFGRQVECAGSLFREYLTSIEENGTTISGWGTGIEKATSEGIYVTPKNAATAALYTYTPWVLEGSGGNWLFWNVYRKFSYNIFKTRPNYQWVGSTCDTTFSCAFEGGICMKAANPCVDGSECEGTVPVEWSAVPEGSGETGWGTPAASGGTCTAPCDLYCEDSSNPFTSITFCAALQEPLLEDDPDEGWCVARCDLTLFPENAGCADGYTCAPARRANDPLTVKDVCWPDAFGKQPASEEESVQEP